MAEDDIRQTMELNSRELAVLCWLAVFFGWILFMPKIRSSAVSVVRAFLQRKILMAVAAMLVYIVACVALLNIVGVWEWSNLKTTLVWGLTFAFVTMMDANRIAEDGQSFSGLVRETLSATAVVVFIAEFYTFPFWAELLFVPAMTFLVALVTVAQLKPEYASAARFLGSVQSVAGLGVLGFSLYMITTNLGDFATLQTARDFGVPILLSLLFLPFIYALTLLMTYETAFLKLRFAIKDHALRRYARRQAVLAFGCDTDFLKRWVRNVQIINVTDRDGIKQSVRELKKIKRRERNPPVVAANEGWSPYEAMMFLREQEFIMGDYHHSSYEWFAESRPLKFDGGIFSDWITYYAEGKELAATRLKLTLNANQPGDPQAADQRFFSIAETLLNKALGPKAAVTAMGQLGRADHMSVVVDGKTIELSRDDWGIPQRGGYERRLVIRHPADEVPTYK